MIVIDTQIVIYWSVPGPNSTLAARVRRRDSVWAAPVLWRSEFRNVMLLHIRSGNTTADGAQRAFRRSLDAFAGREHQVDSGRVFRLGQRHPLTAYDLEFVATAMELGVPLVTFDREILREFPDVAVDPETFCARV